MHHEQPWRCLDRSSYLVCHKKTEQCTLILLLYMDLFMLMYKKWVLIMYTQWRKSKVNGCTLNSTYYLSLVMSTMEKKKVRIIFIRHECHYTLDMYYPSTLMVKISCNPQRYAQLNECYILLSTEFSENASQNPECFNFISKIINMYHKSTIM